MMPPCYPRRLSFSPSGSTRHAADARRARRHRRPLPPHIPVQVLSLGWVWPPPGDAAATARYPLPAVTKEDPSYIDQSYWRGRAWAPMIQIVYWALRQYEAVPEARGAADGLVAQAKALLLKEWDGYGGDNAFAGTGRYVYENFDPETGEGYGFSSEAQPMYSWGALAGFVGMQHAGFYGPFA